MEPFIELLREVNIVQIFILLSAGWMAYSRLHSRLEKIEDRLTRLENDMHQIQIEMIEMKTILRFKKCNLMNDERQNKKAE
jgi:hypothetical protein